MSKRFLKTIATTTTFILMFFGGSEEVKSGKDCGMMGPRCTTVYRLELRVGEGSRGPIRSPGKYREGVFSLSEKERDRIYAEHKPAECAMSAHQPELDDWWWPCCQKTGATVWLHEAPYNYLSEEWFKGEIEKHNKSWCNIL